MDVDISRKEISFYLRLSSDFIFFLQHVFKKNQFVEKLRRKNLSYLIKHLERVRATQGISNGLIVPIERKKNLNATEFINNHIKKQVPVIFEGAALSWPCTQKWNFEFLLKCFEHENVNLVSRVGLMEDDEPISNIPSQEFSETISIKDFVSSIQNGGKKYLRFSSIMESHEELIQDLDQNWLRNMRQCFFGVSYQTFIGPKGKVTPTHGGESTSFFAIMADGEKTWDLIPTYFYPFLNPSSDGSGYNHSSFVPEQPDLVKYPGAKLIHRYRGTIKKGDILYVPAWMWHYVKSEKDSWSVSYRFTNIRGIFSEPIFVVIRSFFTEPNIIKTLYYSVFKSDLPRRKNKLLTPKLYR